MLRFVRQLIHLRLHFDQKAERTQTTLEGYLRKSRIEWHGIEVGKPDWRSDSHSLALSLHNVSGTQVRYIAINAYWQPLKFELPSIAGVVHREWHRSIDTSLPAPDDVIDSAMGLRVTDSHYLVNARSIVMLDSD
jgi:glycogen operon protein